MEHKPNAFRRFLATPRWANHWAAKTYFAALMVYLVLKLFGVVE